MHQCLAPVRNFFIVTHRWIALIGGVFIAIAALSGTAVAYEQQIDRWANPQLWKAPGTGAPLNLDTLVARASAALPGVHFDGVVLPSEAGRATVLTAGRDQVFVDPSTGHVLGRRTGAQRNAGLARRLHVLHTQLMGGRIGNVLVYLSTLGALYLVVTGVVLWWPDKIFGIRWSASWKRINFDLHHLLGILTAVVLFVVTLTGVTMSTRPITRLIVAVGDVSPRPRQKQPPGDTTAPTISLTAAATAARARMPGAELNVLSFPAKPDAPFEAQMQFPEDRSDEGGRTFVRIDRYRGGILAALSSREVRPGSTLIYLEGTLHTGAELGTPGLIIWGICSVILATQALTGFLMWWNARPGRKKA